MKEKIADIFITMGCALGLLAIITFSVIGVLAIRFHNSAERTKHTFCNVAVYEGGALVDEDGMEFEGNWNLEEGTYFVTYDNKGTVTRLDDEPINFERLD